MNELYSELIALTRVFISQDFEKNSKVESSEEGYTYFKEFCQSIKANTTSTVTTYNSTFPQHEVSFSTIILQNSSSNLQNLTTTNQGKIVPNENKISSTITLLAKSESPQAQTAQSPLPIPSQQSQQTSSLNLETIVRDDKVIQSFELESLADRGRLHH